MTDELTRLRAVAAEWRDEVASDRTRAESIEGHYGYGSPESDAAWAEHRASLARRDEAAAALDAFSRERRP